MIPVLLHQRHGDQNRICIRVMNGHIFPLPACLTNSDEKGQHWIKTCRLEEIISKMLPLKDQKAPSSSASGGKCFLSKDLTHAIPELNILTLLGQHTSVLTCRYTKTSISVTDLERDQLHTSDLAYSHSLATSLLW